MKKIICSIFIILLLCITFLFSLPAKPNSYVTDEAGMLTPQSKQFIEMLVTQVEQKSGAEIAVVTVKDIGGETIETYAVNLFESWGIGKKDKDNGILLLIALQERKIRIEVGYELEGVINDAKAGDIIRDHITPYFKESKFSQGIVMGTLMIVSYLADHYKISIEGINNEKLQNLTRRKKSKIFANLIFLIFFLLLFAGRFLFSFLFVGGGYWGGGSGGFGGGSFGGGFGGGMSGGGGASGGW